MTPEIICLGEAMFELNQPLGAISFEPGFGGDTSNCAIAAARQGASVAYCSAVGADIFGDALIDLWIREGVDIAMVKRNPAAPTGIYFVTHSHQARQFHYYRKYSAASLLSKSDLDPSKLNESKIFHFSAISQAISDSVADLTFHALELARDARVIVSYDTNLRLKLWPLPRAKAIIQQTVSMSDVVKVSLEDAHLLTLIDDAQKALDYFLALGPRFVAITMGANGTWAGTQDNRVYIPPITVNAVDATGAGDVFNGAFLAEYIRVGDFFKAADYANVAAALSTRYFGAVASIPKREAVENAMAHKSL